MADATDGDRDPLDVCVFSERPINRAEIILSARVIGGVPTLDHGTADDKIVTVLEGDAIWGNVQDISDFPPNLIDRLRHYFANYKSLPGEKSPTVIGPIYGAARAAEVIAAALADYREAFGGDA
jgi:inorganic pyrophosphatase